MRTVVRLRTPVTTRVRRLLTKKMQQRFAVKPAQLNQLIHQGTLLLIGRLDSGCEQPPEAAGAADAGPCDQPVAMIHLLSGGSCSWN